MTNNKPSLNEIIARRDALRNEFTQLQFSTKAGTPRTPEEKAETARILAEAKRLDADIDAYMLENNIDNSAPSLKGTTMQKKIKQYVQEYKAELALVGAAVTAGAVTAFALRGKRVDLFFIIRPKDAIYKPVAVPIAVLNELKEFWDLNH